MLLYKDAAADVRVRVRRRVVVHVKQPVIPVLAVIPADVQARVRRVEVPVIRDAPGMPRPSSAARMTPKFSPLLLSGERRVFDFFLWGEGCAPPPTPPSFRGVSGGGSRCSCTRPTPRRSPRKTARDSGPGRNSRRRTGTGSTRGSPSYPGRRWCRSRWPPSGK